MRGPRSRAGLIAYPVGPPRERPMPQTRLPTRYGPSPAAGPAAETPFEKIAPTTNTSTKNAKILLSKFQKALRNARAVTKQPPLHASAGRAFPVGKKVRPASD